MMRFLATVLLPPLLWAGPLFDEAKRAYTEGNYTGALPLFLQSAETEGDEEAAYYLGIMYEEGLGAPVDLNASHYWYKRAANRYHTIATEGLNYDLEKERRRFAETVNVEDADTKKTIEQKALSQFGLRAFRDNYFLPVSCGDFGYRSYVPSDSYDQCEAEVQLSFGYDFMHNVFGLGEIYTLAYTQRSYWQIYTGSKPFRETNYNPAFIVTVPRNDHFGPVALKALSFSLEHHSNGQGNVTEQGLVDANVTDSALIQEHPEWAQNRSRSWNYFTASAVLQYGALFAEFTGWARFPESEIFDDNPELLDYLGYGSLRLYYPSGKSVSQLLIRHNIVTGKGAVEATWSYPLAERAGTYWYVKLFSGYGESLIDYNHYINKFGIGLSFSR
jgi:phospholipase A1